MHHIGIKAHIKKQLKIRYLNRHCLKKNEKNMLLVRPNPPVLGLCPNCVRQGQIFPNSSKRNQKSATTSRADGMRMAP